MSTAEWRLEEWAIQLHSPGWAVPQTTGGVLGRLAEEGQDERLRSVKSRARRMRLIRGVTGRRRKGQQMPCKETRCAKVKVLVHDGEAFATTPDGGMGLMIDRMAGDIEQSNRCREMARLYEAMPLDYKSYVDATYRLCASPREVPRPWKEAARMMGTGKSAYFDRQAKVYAWLEERFESSAPIQRRAA